MLIEEIANTNDVKQLRPIKEKQDIFIPNINDLNISRRNGMVYVLSGSGGSGKSSLLLSMFKSKNYYRNKFDNIYYFCPASSFDSVASHPFATHDKVYHELTVEKLDEIYNELASEKKESKKEKKDKRKTLALFETGFEEEYIAEEEASIAGEEECEIVYKKKSKPKKKKKTIIVYESSSASESDESIDQNQKFTSVASKCLTTARPLKSQQNNKNAIQMHNERQVTRNFFCD